MIAGVHPVCIHSAKVLDLQFDERAGELGGVAEFDGELVCNALDQSRGLGGKGERRGGNLPAWNSNFRLRMFMSRLMMVSAGARMSEKRMKPMMMGESL